MNIIYADMLFALSVFTDYLLLLVTARFCSLRLRRWRYLAAAMLGGVYAVAVFLPGMTWLAHPLCELCAAGFLGLIAFGGEEKLFRCCAAFLAVSASFGGAAWAVCMQYPGRDVSNPGLLIGVFLVSYAVLTLLSYTRRRRARQHLAAVTLALGPQSASFTALEDSGNCLSDPITGDKVMLASPAALLPLCTTGAFPKSYTTRVNEIPNTYSAFTLYIQFKENAFPYINHTCYEQDDYGEVWEHGEYDAHDWPKGFMYMTPADAVDAPQTYASKMIINCLMPFSVVERWENTRVGHRGEEYKIWKQQHVEKVLDKMELLYPGFRNTVQYVEASSPLTIRDYYHQPQGALYGMRKDCRNIMLSQIPLYTKVRNLFLTGQNINLHGICGVPLTAINTAEAIMGEKVLVERINSAG